MTVLPFNFRAHDETAGVLNAMRRHPAGSAMGSVYSHEALPQITDPAAALTQVARSSDRLHRDLTAGPGALSDENGWEALQVMVAGLVHRAARPGLVYTWCQVMQAVQRLDQIQDGDLTPDDLSCMTVAEAIAKCDAELDWQLYPLIHGLPSTDACRDCVRTCPSVNQWQTRTGCTNHTGRAI